MENKYNQSNNANGSAQKKFVTYTNFAIRGSHVKVIENGREPRIMATNAAIEYAQSQGLDLVQISFDKQNRLPITKIMDYGKFKYEQQKKDKAAKKAARAAAADVKEVCFSIRIDDNDKLTKVNHIKKFIEEDNAKVKINIKLLRREMNLLGMAKDLMRSILTNFDGIAELDSNPTFNSGIMSCVIRPTKK